MVQKPGLPCESRNSHPARFRIGHLRRWSQSDADGIQAVRERYCNGHFCGYVQADIAPSTEPESSGHLWERNGSIQIAMNYVIERAGALDFKPRVCVL